MQGQQVQEQGHLLLHAPRAQVRRRSDKELSSPDGYMEGGSCSGYTEYMVSIC
ncbi:hypothetical protein ACP4OV_005440 [Aristida adscensionis]